jgi:hypothetical protein
VRSEFEAEPQRRAGEELYFGVAFSQKSSSLVTVGPKGVVECLRLKGTHLGDSAADLELDGVDAGWIRTDGRTTRDRLVIERAIWLRPEATLLKHAHTREHDDGHGHEHGDAHGHACSERTLVLTQARRGHTARHALHGPCRALSAYRVPQPPSRATPCLPWQAVSPYDPRERKTRLLNLHTGSATDHPEAAVLEDVLKQAILTILHGIGPMRVELSAASDDGTLIALQLLDETHATHSVVLISREAPHEAPPPVAHASSAREGATARAEPPLLNCEGALVLVDESNRLPAHHCGRLLGRPFFPELSLRRMRSEEGADLHCCLAPTPCIACSELNDKGRAVGGRQTSTLKVAGASDERANGAYELVRGESGDAVWEKKDGKQRTAIRLLEHGELAAPLSTPADRADGGSELRLEPASPPPEPAPRYNARWPHLPRTQAVTPTRTRAGRSCWRAWAATRTTRHAARSRLQSRQARRPTTGATRWAATRSTSRRRRR